MQKVDGESTIPRAYQLTGHVLMLTVTGDIEELFCSEKMLLNH